jgi:DNA-directed RNA polymerase specialized sigma24 family protein
MNSINDKIENALKDINIVKIMNMASKRFKNQLNKDIIYSCQLNALWKSFLNHDPLKGAKFTTYLYQGVFIECMKEIKFNQKSQRNKAKLHDNIACKHNPYYLIDILDELKEDQEKDLFLDRISNMTIAEISKKHSINRETVRRKINKIFKNISKNII